MATGGRHGSSGDNDGKPGDTANRRPAAMLNVRATPEWADGLKQLYDAVVEEDLPDQFLDLLDQLDCFDGPGGDRDDASSGSGECR
jgi:hypothetical protein